MPFSSTCPLPGGGESDPRPPGGPSTAGSTTASRGVRCYAEGCGRLLLLHTPRQLKGLHRHAAGHRADRSGLAAGVNGIDPDSVVPVSHAAGVMGKGGERLGRVRREREPRTRPTHREESVGQAGGVDRRQNAAQARRALLDPAACAELLALLGIDDSRAAARAPTRGGPTRPGLDGASLEARGGGTMGSLEPDLRLGHRHRLAGAACIGALGVVVLVAEVYAIRRHRAAPQSGR